MEKLTKKELLQESPASDGAKTMRLLLTTNEAAEYLRLKRQTLATWRHTRKGPDYVKMGRYVMYEKKALDKLISENRVIIN